MRYAFESPEPDRGVDCRAAARRRAASNAARASSGPLRGSPAAGAPPPGRAGAVKIGNILFVGGHTPGPAYQGKLGAGLTVEQGYDGARQACLNC